MVAFDVTRADPATGEITIRGKGTFSLSDVPGNGFNANRLGKINEWLQAKIDHRQALTDLPLDDPDRLIDPDKPTLFWGDADGNRFSTGETLTPTHLIYRPETCVLTWDGSRLTPNSRVL